MRPSALAAAFVFVLGGCARIGTPNAPVVVTAAGRRCVAQCQSLHGRCLARADATKADYWSFANPVVDKCNDQLGHCYGTCPS